MLKSMIKMLIKINFNEDFKTRQVKIIEDTEIKHFVSTSRKRNKKCK